MTPGTLNSQEIKSEFDPKFEFELKESLYISIWWIALFTLRTTDPGGRKSLPSIGL